MQTKDGTNLNVKFEKHFTVDWVDHNIYSFSEQQLRVHKFTQPSVSKVIYNGSKKVRNIVVEQKRHFVAWISNDNNIVKTNKVC